ncbi:DNA polymerase III subunit gamma/tau [Skermanella stibiiresistens SB22]|uniref:DNA polymerase III subunit gamma/tau n=1 Tax=Skermanella stibiiresistens SB22 TaxID=1385369 RepID=W9GZI0_9PROT|nr:DNA polymerase III subunit gamma/tau [Skermanella stibiiresistens]EWY39199.1 DNA polymerase III subunit gamma/tau [Skermanella stibiiresistens SB22]
MTDQTLPPLATHDAAPGTADGGGKAYRVLARKYRPRDFSELVGQEALVRTLTNAIKSGRLAHAFMLTGVRGVGKTTTARIIARALNCVGPDGTGGPTITPCGVCENCKSITADRHVDVMEMDAASRTGVDDIREIIDGVRYGPVAARYKVYIIDEVHMLTKNAFNALLKTLEEPPEHVKFIFATTEIRKVPVTVLSRCQRFDLRRIDSQTLVKHFNRVAEAEGVKVEPDAMALIARAADGSARDGLSLLDQAIALGGETLSALQVRDMLGLADRARVVDLFEATMTGQPRDALDILSDLHRSGADPVVVLQDLLDFTHFLTRFKVVPETAQDPGTPETERTRGGELAGKLGMPALTRAWQILLKGLGEVQSAPVPFDAAEMVIVRLAYSADLPNPADLIRQLQGQPQAGGVPSSAPPAGGGGGGGGTRAGGPALAVAHSAQPGTRAAAEPAVTAHAAPEQEQATAEPLPEPKTFREVVALFGEMREGSLYGQLYSSVHCVRCEPGRLEIRPKDRALAELSGRVGKLLTEWTGRRWMVTISGAPGEPTLSEQDRNAKTRAREEAARHPVVRAVLDIFPGAEISEVRDLTEPEPAPDAALAEDAIETDFYEETPSELDDIGEF